MAKGKSVTHGESHTYLYEAWRGMRARCKNKNLKGYKNYGGRGIFVCEEWDADYAAFSKYVQTTMGPRPSSKHSIDRIENDDGYRPGNIRWATKAVQMANRRNSKCPKKGAELAVLPVPGDPLWVEMLSRCSGMSKLAAAETLGVSTSLLTKVATLHGFEFKNHKRPRPVCELPESSVPFSKTQRLSDLDPLI